MNREHGGLARRRWTPSSKSVRRIAEKFGKCYEYIVSTTSARSGIDNIV